MTFGREFKPAFPGGGGEAATLGDAAAAEGEEQARQLDARKRAAGGLRGERDVTKLGLAASGDGRRGRCNWLNRYARLNFCAGRTPVVAVWHSTPPFAGVRCLIA